MRFFVVVASVCVCVCVSDTAHCSKCKITWIVNLDNVLRIAEQDHCCWMLSMELIVSITSHLCVHCLNKPHASCKQITRSVSDCIPGLLEADWDLNWTGCYLKRFIILNESNRRHNTNGRGEPWKRDGFYIWQKRLDFRWLFCRLPQLRWM